MDAVERFIALLEADISDRRGLRHEWDKIDADVKEEIRMAWRNLISQFLPLTDVLAFGEVTALRGDLKHGIFDGSARVWFGGKEADFGISTEQFNRISPLFNGNKRIKVGLVLVGDEPVTSTEPKPKTTVHILKAGLSLCKFTNKLPRDWPAGQKWAYSADELKQLRDPEVPCMECVRQDHLKPL